MAGRKPLSTLISLLLLTGAGCLVGACAADGGRPETHMHLPYDFTAGTTFDIVRVGDPTSFVCLHDRGRGRREMWDKRVDREFLHNVFLFDAYFSDGVRFEVHVNPEFETVAAARTEAFRYMKGLGQLPTVLRAGIRSLGVHRGDKTASAGSGKMFVYQGNAIRRQSRNKLEETLFHESVHASLDNRYMNSREWRTAQAADPGFMTEYARDRYPREDMAETALLAWAILRHPGRIPPVDTDAIKDIVPNRIAFIGKILPVEGPIFDIPDSGPVTLADAPEGCMEGPPA